jgi:CubicO group peptidase (beta-lactamase class C family)
MPHPHPAASLLTLLALASAMPSRGQDLSTLVRDAVAAPLAEGKLIGAVTLVARDGQIVDLQSHGLADRETKRAMTPDTIFRIHSFTKAVTSAAALMLHEEGKFQFTDPVSRWIPSYANLKVGGQPAQREMLVWHLFTHTSGLTYENRSVFDAGDTAAVAEAIAKTPLAFEPGTSWSYGVSIDVLGRLVEIWSGQPLPQFFQERLFGPLGMTDTAFHVPAEKRNRLATLYRDEEKSPGKFRAAHTAGLNEKPVPKQQPQFCMPGGGLYSTATDYYRFLQMIQNDGELDGKRFLKPETVALMRTNQVPANIGWIRFGKELRDGLGFGYGFNVVSEQSQWDPDAKVGEFGWGGAASCHYWMHPDHKLIVITLEQTMPYRWTLERALKAPLYRHFAAP